MDELIRQQKNEEACRYIDKLLASRGLVYQGAVNSGNMLVDGLVNYKIPYIKSLHIDFRSEVMIPSNLDNAGGQFMYYYRESAGQCD